MVLARVAPIVGWPVPVALLPPEDAGTATIRDVPEPGHIRMNHPLFVTANDFAGGLIDVVELVQLAPHQQHGAVEAGMQIRSC